MELTNDVSDFARRTLADLRAGGEGGELSFSYLSQAIERLVRLHAMTPDGGLPSQVDGLDFPRKWLGFLTGRGGGSSRWWEFLLSRWWTARPAR